MPLTPFPKRLLPLPIVPTCMPEQTHCLPHLRVTFLFLPLTMLHFDVSHDISVWAPALDAL